MGLNSEMKLIDAIKIKQRKFEIPDCTRNDLPGFFAEMGYKVGAEIGVWKGRFTERFVRQGLTMYAVDPWTPYWQGQQKPGWLGDTQENHDGFYKIACWRLNRYQNCTIIRKASVEAAPDFNDGSLDFVYIDGNHSFRYVAEDICVWEKKVRSGGIMSGHDYILTEDWTNHVQYVVDAYTKAFGLTLYVLGSEIPVSGEIRDHVRSWMWFKE